MIQEILKDDRRGRGVEPSLPPAPALLVLGQTALCLVARESLILKMDRQRRVSTQRLDEVKDVCRLTMGRPVQGPRQAHHDAGQAVLLTHEDSDLTGDRHRSLLHRPGDREDPQGGRQYGCCVTESQAYPAFTDVHAEHAHTSTIMVSMSRRARLVILFVSVPVVAFTMVGGFLGQAVAREDTYRHLRIFEDVVSLISSNYVEEVDLEDVMQGALRGLAGGLDSDSAFLSADDVRWMESGAPLPEGELGLEVTSQYYLQIIAARPDSPASRAGLVPGDFIRAIDGQTTRRLSALEGNRRLRGEPGTSVSLSVIRGNRTEPYDFELTRQRFTDGAVATRMLDESLGYVRVTRFTAGTSDELATAVSELLDSGANALLVDVRSTAGGSFEEGIAAARLFVGSGTLLRRTEHGDQHLDVSATAGTEAVDTPLVVLTDFGTAHAAELFVAGLSGTDRADTVGQRTAGRASIQKLVKLLDGTGLWLSWARYLQASGDPIHRSGIRPTVAVDVPVVGLGEPVPSDDVILEQGLEHLRSTIL